MWWCTLLQQGKDVLVLGILCEEVQNAPVTVPNILALGVGGAIWHDHGKFHLVIPQEPSIFWVIGFDGPPSKAMLFADFLVQWLEIAKSTVKLTTYSSYKGLSESQIIPYFRSLGVTLGDLKAVHIQSFYQKQLERVKPNTVIHYHAIIHRALKYAVKTALIAVNPADKVDRPKKNEFTGNFYSREEMNALFDAVRGNKIEIPVMLAAFYGLRRSEVVGLKWDAVDPTVQTEVSQIQTEIIPDLQKQL